MNIVEVKRIERAPALRRGIEVWYAAFGGIAAWTVHLLFVASFEHWTFLHSEYSWTLHAVTVVCTLATVAAMLLARRLLNIAAGSDPASNDDAGQLLFLAQLGLLVGAINLALILLEGSFVLFIPRG
ncbi:MAG: hypothetical protein JWM72_4389 [Actinomycetia bacterium]|jgi:hypothetical protein|nr:hypothetical protein [Actinomycetes bacterium]MDQ1461005.1 hypothetical protein [Actinomycetota bacterium]